MNEQSGSQLSAPPTQASSHVGQPSVPAENAAKKRRKHRGKKKKPRRQSFAALSETSTMPDFGDAGFLPNLTEEPTRHGSMRPTYYSHAASLSDDSLDSEALLDHRDQPTLRPRRESRAGLPASSYRQTIAEGASPAYRQETTPRHRRSTRTRTDSSRAFDALDTATDRTPLLGNSFKPSSPTEAYRLSKTTSRQRRDSSSTLSNRRKGISRNPSYPAHDQDYDINNPPSIPPSPQLGAGGGVDDVMVSGADFLTRSLDSRRNLADRGRDALIDIEGRGPNDPIGNSAPPSPRLGPDGIQRRRTIGMPTSDDVCFPVTTMSELGEEDFDHLEHLEHPHPDHHRKRKRRRGYPQLWNLDEWSREEKESRIDGVRTKKIAEPVLVDGRLRPSKGGWRREEDDKPFRYTYFNEDFDNTIHAQTISELLQPGQTFRDLFIPEPIEISDTESEEDENPPEPKDKAEGGFLSPTSQNGDISQAGNTLDAMIANIQQSSAEGSGKASHQGSHSASAAPTPQNLPSPHPTPSKPKQFGRRPAYWLDVLCPTNQEMQVLCRTFGIHALTAEDIMLQEAREKVELFKHYYFINYRTFEQDPRDEEYMEPLNVYVIVFQGGVISFHWSQIPHPANVRRRIRQLTDYLELSPDWIAYAIIDDITDVYQPIIDRCEVEVDTIDENILKLLQETQPKPEKPKEEKEEHENSSDISEEYESSFELMLRIGECRKKVMSLYRLLGTKADVIKGFAKRCNEHWEVAPKSEIGLYLGDIQDHILTMTGNLGHYENLLSRAHSNYLAQISLKMNERQEQTADVLGKLTVVGTVALPMTWVVSLIRW